MSLPFKESSIYKQGVLYKEIGELLMNPDTTIDDMSDFCFSRGIDFDFIFKPAVAAIQQGKDNDE